MFGRELQLLLLLLLLLLLSFEQSLAQFGLTESSVTNDNFQYPEYAQPWSIGQNVCSFLVTKSGRRLYTSCFPYKQNICGAETKFRYECCPGFGHDSRYKGYSKTESWPYEQRNCLKQFLPSDTSLYNKEYLKFIEIDGMLSVLERVFGREQDQATVFIRQKQFFGLVKGIIYAKQLLDYTELPGAFGRPPFKISHYSNGIICVDCARLISVDHKIRAGSHRLSHILDGGMPSERGSVLQRLEKFRYFYDDIPNSVRSLLGNTKCRRQYYTVLVPPEAKWQAAKARAGADGLEDLVREHIITELVCQLAVCSASSNHYNLNGERMQFGCSSESNITVQVLHELAPKPARLMLPPNEQNDNMVENGVIYSIYDSLPHSSATPFDEIDWPNVPKSCVQLQPDKKYIFLIPTKEAWDRFNSFSGNISQEEKMQKFKNQYDTDPDYRCLVKKYHVLEADSPELLSLVSQNNPLKRTDASSPQPGSYRTLAKWPDAKRAAYGFLRNQLHFQKADSSPRLHFQFAPVRSPRGSPLKEGVGYSIDWVNIPPHESSMDFLERRPDLSSHLKLVRNEAKRRKNRPLYENEASVQLLIVARDDWYDRKLKDKDVAGVKTFYQAVKNNWNETDYLLLNWANLYYWIGDLGFLGKGERVFLQSGHPNVLIGVYRHAQNGKFFVWNQLKGSSESMNEVQNRWSEIVEYNHFKHDAVIWIVDKPMLCTKEICQNNLNGKTRLPWSFATACGDFVSMRNRDTPAVKEMFKLAAGRFARVNNKTMYFTLTSGLNAGKNTSVSCFSIAMPMTKNIVMEHDDGIE